jgi:hypothetical protein
MVEDKFGARALANMNVALERVCGKSLSGERHDARKRVAQAIVRCAKSDKITLGAFTEAGDKALGRATRSAA